MLYSRYWRSIFVPNDRLPIEKRLHKRPIAFSYQNLLWRAFHFSTRSIGWRRNDWSERPVWKFCGNAIGRQELSGYRSRHRHHAHGQINCGCPAQWQVTFNPPPSYINAPHPSNPFLNRRVLLLFFNRSQRDIIWKEEFRELEHNYPEL